MEKKYILTEDTNVIAGHTLHRIEAIRDFDGIKAGDFGGFIESERNLSHEGTCWVYNDAKVYGEARVFEKSHVYKEAEVFGQAQIYGEAEVYGMAKVYGDAEVYGMAAIFEEAEVFGQAQVYGESVVYGKAHICEKAEVFRHARVYEEAVVCGKSHVCERAVVCGKAHINTSIINGNAHIATNAIIKDTSDYICIGPIGSQVNYITFYKDKVLNIAAFYGHFRGSIDEFENAVRMKHDNNLYTLQCLTTIAYAKKMFALSI